MPAVSEGLIGIHQFTLDNHLNCPCLPSSLCIKPGFRNCIFPKAFGPATLAFRSVVLKLLCILESPGLLLKNTDSWAPSPEALL